MRPLYIFDLDGTLALIDHRRHLVERPDCPYCGWSKTCDHDLPANLQPSSIPPGERPPFKPDWPAFYAACVHDEPNMPVIQTLQTLRRGGAECWIWSGRSDEVRSETVAWLCRHGCFGWPANTLPAWPFGAPGRFRMRPAGDFTPDEKLKFGWLAEMEPPERRRLTAVFDDRDKVVAMWRRHGVPCFQVAPGAF